MDSTKSKTKRAGCAIVTAVTLVVLLSAFVFLRSRIDTSEITERLLPQIAAQAGLQLKLGEVSGVGLTRLQIAGVQLTGSAGESCMSLDAEALELRWQLRPLLQRRVVVERFALVRPNVDISLVCSTPTPNPRSTQGDRGAKDPQTDPETDRESDSAPTAGATEEPEQKTASASLEINEIVLEEGSLTVREQQASEPILTLASLTLRLVDIEASDEIKAAGDLEGSGLQLGDMVASRVTTDLALENGQLHLENLTLDLPQAQVTTTALFDLNRQPLHYELGSDVDLNLDQVMAGDAEAKGDAAMGIARLRLDGVGQGPEPQGLGADGTVALPQGKLGSSPIALALAIATGTPELANLEYRATEARYRVEDGNFRLLDPLVLEAVEGGTERLAGTRIEIQGGAGLDASLAPSLDLTITTRLPRDRIDIDEVRQVLDLLADDDGVVLLPIQVTGSLTDPRVRLDSDALTRAAGRGIKREAGRRLFRELGKLLNEG